MPAHRAAAMLLRRARPARLHRPAWSQAIPQASFTLSSRASHDPTSSSSSSSSSVNPEEISHFNALASTWWDPHGSSRLLHLMNPLRHDFIAACHASQPDAPAHHLHDQHASQAADSNTSSPAASPPPPGLRYLDVGCGGGIFAESAARLPSTSSVLAIDAAPDVLSVARAHAKRDPTFSSSFSSPPLKRLSYKHTSIESLPLPATEADKYDIVTCFEVVEHVTHPAPFLDRCGEFVKPGGWLVLSTIARTWMSWFTTNFVAEDLLRIVPRGTHDWDKYLNEEELRGHFARRGWNSPRCMGVVYVPGFGWREVRGSEKVGNYFFAVRKDSR